MCKIYSDEWLSEGLGAEAAVCGCRCVNEGRAMAWSVCMCLAPLRLHTVDGYYCAAFDGDVSFDLKLH